MKKISTREAIEGLVKKLDGWEITLLKYDRSMQEWDLEIYCPEHFCDPVYWSTFDPEDLKHVLENIKEEHFKFTKWLEWRESQK